MQVLHRVGCREHQGEAPVRADVSAVLFQPLDWQSLVLGPLTGTRKHRGHDVKPCDLDTRPRDRQGDAPGSAGHLQDRTARPDRLAEEERDVVGPRGELLIVEVRIVVHGQVLQWLHRATADVGPKASARLVRMEPDQLLRPNTLTGMASTPHSRWSVSAGISTGKK